MLEQNPNPSDESNPATTFEQPIIEDVTVRQAMRDIAEFWPFILRYGVFTSSDAVMAYIIAQKELDLLGAYAAYQSLISLATGLLYGSIFSVVTLLSDAKREEDDAVKSGNEAEIANAREKIRLIWRQGIIFSSALAAVAVVFGLTASPLFELFKQPEVVLKNSQRYLWLSTPGFAVDMFYRLTARTASGLGVKKSIMCADTIDKIFELTLAYAFLNGKWGAPQLGIEGVALAYSISKAITLSGHLAYIAASPKCFNFDYTKYNLFQLSGSFFNKEIFMRLLKSGIQQGLQGVVSSVSSMLVTMFCGQSGTAPLVGIQTAKVYGGLMNFHMSAVLNAACSKIGGYYSILEDEKNKYTMETKQAAAKNARIFAKLFIQGCFIMSMIACGLAFLIPRQLASLLNNDPSKQTHLKTAVTFLEIQGMFELSQSFGGSAGCILGALLDNRFLLLTEIFGLFSNSGAAAVARYGLHKDAAWVFAASGLGSLLITAACLKRCHDKFKVFTVNPEAIAAAKTETVSVPIPAETGEVPKGCAARIKQMMWSSAKPAEKKAEQQPLLQAA